jgi:hypothetical protein
MSTPQFFRQISAMKASFSAHSSSLIGDSGHGWGFQNGTRLRVALTFAGERIKGHQLGCCCKWVVSGGAVVYLLRHIGLCPRSAPGAHLSTTLL